MAFALNVGFATLFFCNALAMPWIEPLATPMGLMATAGISPRPTQSPSPPWLSGELRQRQTVIFPPPLNWCGFANSLYSDPLSCSVGLTCVNSGVAMGCCTATTGICSALYTTCANLIDTCDAACQADPAIRKCGIDYPFCGTYEFIGGTRLFNCQLTSALPTAVEFLNDYYISAIGSTVGGASTAVLGISALVSLGAAPTSESPTTTGFISSPSSTFNSDSLGGGLPAVAIDGITAGGSIVVAMILGLIVFFCVRRRRHRRRMKASNRNNSTYAPITTMPPMPPMQQQRQQQQPLKTFDGYYSVPQQDSQNHPSPPQEQPYQYPPYSSPLLDHQGQQQQRLSSNLPAPAGTPVSNPTGTNTYSSTDAPPSTLTPSPSAPTQSYYRPPLSPDIREVDATMGNPGVPVRSGEGGVQQQGPSSNSTEIDSTPVRASLNTPFTGVYYEMPGERS